MIDLNKLSVAVRARRGRLTLRQAAAEAGVNHATIRNLESGRAPDVETFARICRWVGVPAEFFFEAAEDAA